MQIHFLSEGEQSQSCHLEVLLSPRDPDDCDAEQQAAEEVAEAGPEAAEDQPQQVERDADAAVGRVGVRHCGTERPKAQQTDLERLQRPRDTDDGAGQRKAAREVADGGFEATENQPDKVSKYLHNYPTCPVLISFSR